MQESSGRDGGSAVVGSTVSGSGSSTSDVTAAADAVAQQASKFLQHVAHTGSAQVAAVGILATCCGYLIVTADGRGMQGALSDLFRWWNSTVAGPDATRKVLLSLARASPAARQVLQGPALALLAERKARQTGADKSRGEGRDHEQARTEPGGGDELQ